ncbi:prealbumin-like fold domain-containing protein, partial [Coprobacillus cateniformis]
LNIVFKILVVIAILLQIPFSNFNNVYAANVSNVDDFPKDGSVVYNGKISYGGNIVGDFTVYGKQAFCMAHPLATPGTGVKLTSEIYKDTNIKKVLYYGWQGVEQWSGFESRAHGIVVTSLALSYYYYGDNSSPKTIKNFMEYIKNKSVPNFSVTFSKSKVSAYRDGNVQRTETVTLNSGSDLFGIDITIPKNVTYVDETHGTRQTGGSVTIKGKTKFHFEAPLNEKLDSWNINDKISSFAFQPIIAIAGSSYQTTGSWDYVEDPSKTTSLTVDWLQLGSIEITKNDIYGNLIDGAVFRLWNNDSYDENVTVTNGKIKVENLTTGIYYLQEQTAPNGFLVDNTIYTVTLNAGDEIKQTVTDKEPQGTITVTKTNDMDNKVSNAKFYVKADGDIRSAGGNLLYSNGAIVDTLTTNASGVDTTVELPLGNYIVEEYEVPHGYLLNKNKYKVSLKYANQNTPVVTTSTTISNDEPLGTIEFQKEIDSDVTNNLEGDVFLSNLKYGLYAR